MNKIPRSIILPGGIGDDVDWDPIMHPLLLSVGLSWEEQVNFLDELPNNTLVAGAPSFFSGLGLLMSGIDEKVSLEGELRDGRALVLRIVGDHAVWPSGVPSMVGRADL